MSDVGKLQFVNFMTTNCIVTGEPAQIYTGHVVARGAGEIYDQYQMRLPMIGVTAGFASREISESVVSDEFGCYGLWKPQYGIKWESSPYEGA